MSEKSLFDEYPEAVLFDTLSGEQIDSGDKKDMDRKCERLGGAEKCYFVVEQ